MNWIVIEIHNIPVILCGIFNSILCIFGIVTGLMYAFNQKKQNSLKLSDKFMEKLSDEDKLKKITIKWNRLHFLW